MNAILSLPMRRMRSLPWWAVGLVCALAAGAFLRLVWGLDIEYKGDEVWTFEHARQLLSGEAWPWLGMPSSVGLPNPGLSLWVFGGLQLLFGAQSPPELARAVQLTNVAALVLLCVLALRLVPAAEREPWLWAVALAAVNPLTVLFHRKIWPPSVLPLFLVLLLAGWWRRERRGGALLWGLTGALIGQIHLSGIFFSATLAAGTWLRDRAGVAWRYWLTGAVLGAIPLLPWLACVAQGVGHTEGTARQWTGLLECKFWLHWVTEPLGIGLKYTLGPNFNEFLAWPVVAGQPLYLAALLHGVMVAAGAAILLRALYRRCRGAGGDASPNALHVNWVFWGYGLVLTVVCLRFYRHYLLMAFPLTFVWLAQLALGRAGRERAAWGRALLLVLCVAQALLSALFLHYVHEHAADLRGEFGIPFAAQQEGGQPLTAGR
jgi:4-amino-4-deoxy-L-arabinose transferase-like glycosyltransferase